MKHKDLEDLLVQVKEECIKEKINMLSVYKILHVVKTFVKNLQNK